LLIACKEACRPSTVALSAGAEVANGVGWLFALQKRCGRRWGTPAAREPGLGTGRGGDVTGAAGLLKAQCVDVISE